MYRSGFPDNFVKLLLHWFCQPTLCPDVLFSLVLPPAWTLWADLLALLAQAVRAESMGHPKRVANLPWFTPRFLLRFSPDSQTTPPAPCMKDWRFRCLASRVLCLHAALLLAQQDQCAGLARQAECRSTSSCYKISIKKVVAVCVSYTMMCYSSSHCATGMTEKRSNYQGGHLWQST